MFVHALSLFNSFLLIRHHIFVTKVVYVLSTPIFDVEVRVFWRSNLFKRKILSHRRGEATAPRVGLPKIVCIVLSRAWQSVASNNWPWTAERYSGPWVHVACAEFAPRVHRPFAATMPGHVNKHH